MSSHLKFTYKLQELSNKYIRDFSFNFAIYTIHMFVFPFILPGIFPQKKKRFIVFTGNMCMYLYVESFAREMIPTYI